MVPKLVEYNARFGDPECQVLMLRMMSDIVPALIACADGQLKNFSLRWFDEVALTVIMATKGYPGDYGKGSVIEGLDDAAKVEGVEIFHAGTKADGAKILANGGRVLNVCATGKTVTEAQHRAYASGRPHQLAGRLLPPRHRLAGGGAGEGGQSNFVVPNDAAADGSARTSLRSALAGPTRIGMMRR